MKTENEVKRVALATLAHAPWNPRTPEELKPDHPAMAELIESVKSVGIIQPIAVWADAPDGDGRKWVIAGNRRMEAALVAGLQEVPALVFEGIDQSTARAITRIENECRFGVSPLKDAELIAGMAKLGRSQSEIAALFGVSEATVCRRAKLSELSPKIVQELSGKDVGAKALEMIAAYPTALQDKAAKDINTYAINGGLKPWQVRCVFNRLTETLSTDAWIFKGEFGERQLAKCRACGKCTGNQPTLFDDVDVDGGDDGDAPLTIGKCLDLKCYKATQAEAKKAIIDEEVARTSGGLGADGIVNVQSTWGEPWTSLKSKKRTKKATFAYVVFNSYSGDLQIMWGPDPKIAEAERAREKEEREAQSRAEEKERAAIQATLDAAQGKVCDFMLGNSGNDDEIKKRLVELLSKLKASVLAEELAEWLADDCFQSGWSGRPSCRYWAAKNFPALKNRLTKPEFEALQKDTAANG